MIEAFQSTEPLIYPHDERLKSLVKVRDWFTTWKNELSVEYLDKKERAQRFVAWQTYEDICLAVNGLFGLTDYVTDLRFLAKHGGGAFIIPKRISQDIVESYFSLRRSACGSNSNMTAFAYGNNTQHLILHHVSQKNLRKRRAAEGLALPKRRKTDQKREEPWPVTIA